MHEHITPTRIANAIMLDTTFTGNYLIVEGNSDYHFYKKFISQEHCTIKQAHGNVNVIEVVEILDSRNFEKKLAILDSDFNKLDSEINSNENIVFTDDHDIEVMIFKSPALERVLELHYSEVKFKKFQGKTGIAFRDLILNLAKPIGYLKWANKTYNLGLVFKPKKPEGKQLKYSKFIDERNLNFKGEYDLINTVVNYSNNKGTEVKSRGEIEESYQSKLKEAVDLLQLCNGHDIANLISLALRKAIGSKNLDYKAIECDLILSFDTSEFNQTEVFISMKKWEKKTGLTILSKVYEFV